MRENRTLPIFAERFAAERIKRGMSQVDFAEFVGVARPTVGFYENGERLPNAFVLRQIAERCGVSTDYLVGIADIPSPNIEAQEVRKHIRLSNRALNKLILNKDQDVFNLFISSVVELTSERLLNSLVLAIIAGRWWSNIPRGKKPTESVEFKLTVEEGFLRIINGESILLTQRDLLDFYRQKCQKDAKRWFARATSAFESRLSYQVEGDQLSIRVKSEEERLWEVAAQREALDKGRMDAGKPDTQ